jgi:hypothetical protein
LEGLVRTPELVPGFFIMLNTVIYAYKAGSKEKFCFWIVKKVIGVIFSR